MDLLTSDNINAAHGFFTRRGGVSEGIFASLNCGYGSGEDKAKVAENRRRVAAHFGRAEAELLTLYQTHSAEVLIIPPPGGGRLGGGPVSEYSNITHGRPHPNPPPAGEGADALVTKTPGLLLGILTADCAPVLFHDANAGVIAAAHAGWKGAHGGIIDSTVAAMCDLGAKKEYIAAAIGPCIAQASYEVGPEFVARIGDDRFFLPSGEKSHFDLPAYVRSRLLAAGIEDIDTIAHDTCAEEARFFSYRRATLRGEGAYGRQISCIIL